MISKIFPLSTHKIVPTITELSKTSKIALALFGLISFAAFFARKMFYRQVEHLPTPKVADVYVSISGNPAHMGHVHMIALAVKRLEEEGYRINKVKVSLGSDQYIQNKVYGDNLLKKASDMYKVALPLSKRSEFLQAVMEEAKDEGVIKRDLLISYYGKGDLFSLQRNEWKNREIFYVCGADFADEMSDRIGSEGTFKHVVIISRNGQVPKEVPGSHGEGFDRFIVCNDNIVTSQYSSSKIQNGSYDMLPASVRNEFRELHHHSQN